MICALRVLYTKPDGSRMNILYEVIVCLICSYYCLLNSKSSHFASVPLEYVTFNKIKYSNHIYITENLHSKDEYQLPQFSSTGQAFPFKRYRHLCFTAQLQSWTYGFREFLIQHLTFSFLQTPDKRAASVNQFCINLLHYHTPDRKYGVLLFPSFS